MGGVSDDFGSVTIKYLILPLVRLYNIPMIPFIGRQFSTVTPLHILLATTTDLPSVPPEYHVKDIGIENLRGFVNLSICIHIG